MRKIRPGTLRHKILIQKSVETTGDYNNVISTWTNVKYSRAFIDDLTGQESFMSERLLNSVDKQVVIRYDKELTPKHRIIFGSDIYDIIHVLNFEQRNIFQTVLCKVDLVDKYIVPIITRVLEDDTQRVLEDGTTLRILEN